MSINEDIVAKIKDLGLVHTSVDFDHVTEMMECVTYETHVIPGTTTTVAYAIHKGFTFASGQAACVHPENFDEEMGRTTAIARATEAAITEMWRLEGWLLHRSTAQFGNDNVCEV